jgi:hypothetical protein
LLLDKDLAGTPAEPESKAKPGDGKDGKDASALPDLPRTRHSGVEYPTSLLPEFLREQAAAAKSSEALVLAVLRVLTQRRPAAGAGAGAAASVELKHQSYSLSPLVRRAQQQQAGSLPALLASCPDRVRHLVHVSISSSFVCLSCG